MTDPLPDLERRVERVREDLRDLTAVVTDLRRALEALREDVTAGRTPTGRPDAPIPDDQQGLPIPPKRPREPGHAVVRTAWGELGLLDAVRGLVESSTGRPPDPDRKPRPREPRQRRERDN